MNVDEAIEKLDPHFQHLQTFGNNRRQDDSCLGIGLAKVWWRLKEIRRASAEVIDAETLIVSDTVEKAIDAYVHHRHGGKAL